MTLTLDSNSETVGQTMNEWLLRNKAAINIALDESFAAKTRGESYLPEEAEAILAARRATRTSRAAHLSALP